MGLGISTYPKLREEGCSTESLLRCAATSTDNQTSSQDYRATTMRAILARRCVGYRIPHGYRRGMCAPSSTMRHAFIISQYDHWELFYPKLEQSPNGHNKNSRWLNFRQTHVFTWSHAFASKSHCTIAQVHSHEFNVAACNGRMRNGIRKERFRPSRMLDRHKTNKRLRRHERN